MAGRIAARDLAQIAVFAALLAALSLPGTLYVAGNAVPITLQTLGVMLAGAVLGARKGFLAVLVYEVLALCGLPVLAGGKGGPAPFVGFTAGYLYGFLVGALVIGALAQWLIPRCPPRLDPMWIWIAVIAVGGIVVIYTLGTTWLVIRGLSWHAAIVGNAVFLLGDTLKVVVAALIAAQVHRAFPDLLGTRRRAVPRTRVPQRARV